ncbi:MAG: glutathione S-transferase N-terminal domain-containing protein [Halobacterium sp.]
MAADARDADSIELYVQPLCPYCRRVKRVLEELDLPYVTHRVSFLKFRRSEVRDVSGQSQVPVLVDPAQGVDGMHESADIVAYLRETYGDAGDDAA